jgi:hypothetical protein
MSVVTNGFKTSKKPGGTACKLQQQLLFFKAASSPNKTKGTQLDFNLLCISVDSADLEGD